MAANVDVLPMVGNFKFVRPELLLGFLIKLNIRTEAGLYSSSPEPQHSKIIAADCSNVKPHYWQYPVMCCRVL